MALPAADAMAYGPLAAAAALAPAWKPDGRADGSIVTVESGVVAHSEVEATFAWMAVGGRPAWQVLATTGRVAAAAKANGEAGVLNDLPQEPDPNPPTQPPPGGHGEVTNTFWSGGSTYT